MNSKIFAVAVAALLVTAGGAAAVGTVVSDETPDTRDADIEATYDGGNVTATVNNGGEPVQNATVEVGDEEYRTDADGVATAPVEDADEVTIEVEAPGFEGEHEYAIVDGTLVLEEESFEYHLEGDEDADDGADDADDDDTEEDEAEGTEADDEDADDDGDEEPEDDDAEEDVDDGDAEEDDADGDADDDDADDES